MLTKDFLTTYKLGWKTSTIKKIRMILKVKNPNITDKKNVATLDEALEVAEQHSTQQDDEEYVILCTI